MQFRAINRCNCTLQSLHQRGMRAVEILCKRGGFALYQQGFLLYQGLLQQESPLFAMLRNGWMSAINVVLLGINR